MKIGIVTFYRVANYGAMLQAYSLMNVLERMGHEVVFIRYKFCSPKRLPVWRTLVSRNLKGLKAKLKNYVCHSITDFASTYLRRVPRHPSIAPRLCPPRFGAVGRFSPMFACATSR